MALSEYGNESEHRIRYKQVPPEGGWGYLVGIGMALPFICAFGILPSFGLMFGDFLTGLGEETSATALITCSFYSALSFAGLFTSALFKRFSIRSVGLFGGITYFVGNVLTTFVTSVPQLLFTFSFLQGAGFGLIIPSAYTTFNAYFVEKRVMMMSIAQTLIGLGNMVYPLLVDFLMNRYGFRGCVAIIAALSSHAIFGMLVMHPVEWHMSVIEIEEYELGVLECHNDNKDVNHLSNQKQMLDPLPDHVEGESKLKKSLPKIDAVCEERADQKEGCFSKIVDFLDLTLLKKFSYVNIVLGISFALYSDMAFFTIQPLYLFDLKYTSADVALIIAIGAAADLLSRIVLAFASACVKVKAKTVYLAGAVFTIFTRIAFLYVFEFTGMAVITAIMGFLRTWLHVPLPLVFAEYLPNERFPSGYGLFMFLQGNITFLIGPIIGWIRDATQSYAISFNCLTFIMALCALPWILEDLCRKFCKSKKSIEAINKV